MFVLPAIARTNKQRQGLNLCGHFIQKAGDLGRQQAMYLNRLSYIPLQTAPFYKEKKIVGKGFGIQGKG